MPRSAPTAQPGPLQKTGSGLVQDAEALLAALSTVGSGSQRGGDDPSPQAAKLEHFRTSSEAERTAAAAARQEEKEWLSNEAKHTRELEHVTSAAAALEVELSTVPRTTDVPDVPDVSSRLPVSRRRTMTDGGQHPGLASRLPVSRHRTMANGAQQQRQWPKHQRRIQRHHDTQNEWVSGPGASHTPRDHEPGWQRRARQATEEREAAELAAAASRSVHRRKLSRAEQERRFEELQKATTRSERKRREAREREEARRRQTLKQQQVHFAKKANWTSLLERLYVPPSPSERRKFLSAGSGAQSRQDHQMQRQSTKRKVLRQEDTGSTELFGASADAADLEAAGLEVSGKLDTAAEAETEIDTTQAARRAMVNWDLATTIEQLTAELEEREAELAQQHEIIDDLYFKLRAVCREGTRRGVDLESWLEDSWEQVELERQMECETSRVQGEGTELRRREFIAEANAEQRRRSSILESSAGTAPVSPDAMLASPVMKGYDDGERVPLDE